MSHIYDVLIVGAGPAGSSAAYHLAKQGIDVLLLDKFTFPRDKACGDVLSPRCLFTLGEMDLLDEVVRLGHRYDTVRLIAPRCHSAQIPLPQRDERISYGLVAPRILLDDVLLQHAVAWGAQFRSPVRVTDVLADEESVEVRGEYDRQIISCRARIAILAVGANSGLLVRTGLLRKMPRMALGARAYFEGVTDLVDQCQLYLDSAFSPGYGWIFPVSDSCVNVGVSFLPSRSKKANHQTPRTAQRAFDAFIHTPLLQGMLAGARRSSPVKGFPMRADFATAPTLGERVLLVGEAAGLVHPLTGEGIAYALESGKLAAEHLSWMLSTGNVSQESLRWYNWQLRLRFQSLFSLFAMARWAPVLYHPFTFTISMNALVESLRLASHIPLARNLSFDGLGAIPNTYPLSPIPLFKRRKRKLEAEKEKDFIRHTIPHENGFYQLEEPEERTTDIVI